MTDHASPIGIFDSGVGGLTVAKAIADALPCENIIYFGDTAHLPYGDKSKSAIRSYCLRICDFLIEQNCKIIVVACHSASAVALDAVQKHTAPIPIINVIDPVVHFFQGAGEYRNIGLIATRQTIFSSAYHDKFKAAGIQAKLQALATPLLVPLIEFGYSNSQICDRVISDYLSSHMMADIDALVLGCTHYPLIKEKIKNFYLNGSRAPNVKMVDSNQLIPQLTKSVLEKESLANPYPAAYRKFFVSDHTESFSEIAKLFFGEHIALEYHPLWES